MRQRDFWGRHRFHCGILIRIVVRRTASYRWVEAYTAVIGSTSNDRPTNLMVFPFDPRFPLVGTFTRSTLALASRVVSQPPIPVGATVGSHLRRPIHLAVVSHDHVSHSVPHGEAIKPCRSTVSKQGSSGQQGRFREKTACVCGGRDVGPGYRRCLIGRRFWAYGTEP